MNNLNGKFSAFQSAGKRDYQEDEFGLLDARDDGADSEEHTVIVVADGMGGHVGGDRASGIVTEVFIDTYQGSEGDIPQRLQQALETANAALANAVAEDVALDGMGSTLVAAVISEDRLWWASVGDSPLWLFRDGELRRLNADHSMTPVLQQMVESGRLTQEQADADPGRHSLLSVLTGEDVAMIDLPSEPLPLHSGDLVLLASDGLLTLSPRQIAQVLETNCDSPVARIVDRLHSAVDDAALVNQDNTTIAIYRVGPAPQILVEPALPSEPVESNPQPLNPLPSSATGESEEAAPVSTANRERYLLYACVFLILIAAVLFMLLNNHDNSVSSADSSPQPLAEEVEVRP